MRKILVVDNEKPIQEAMKTIFLHHGYEVSIADSYKTILPIIYSNKPHIIFLDIMLNNEDGRLICQQLKENNHTKDICIILFSAFPNKLKEYRSYHADGILEKPFDVKDLTEIIQSCSDRKCV